MPVPLVTRLKKGSSVTCREYDGMVTLLHVQGAHGWTVGQVVRPDSATTFTLARADTDANLGSSLWLVFAVLDANEVELLAYYTSRVVEFPAHGLGAFGTALYLSHTTFGAITATPPPPGRQVDLGDVIDANTIHWGPRVQRF